MTDSDQKSNRKSYCETTDSVFKTTTHTANYTSWKNPTYTSDTKPDQF
jgi:hypothetical protein